MSRRCGGLFFVAWGLLAVAGQAQTIQLPTFQTFATSTTVVVPDSGYAFVAGDPQSGYSQFGGSAGALGSMTSGGGVGMIAQIHDLRAMDQQLLAGAAPRPSPPPDAWTARLASARANMAAVPGAGIAEIRQQLAQEDAARLAELADSLERGKRALDEGKPGVAKIYFQSVAKNGTGRLKELAEIELNSLNQRPAAPPVKR